MITKQQLWQDAKKRHLVTGLTYQKATKFQLQTLLNNNRPLYQDEIAQPYHSYPRKRKDNPKIEIVDYMIPERFRGEITTDNVSELCDEIKKFVMFYYDNIGDITSYYNITFTGDNHINNFTYTDNITALLDQVENRMSEYANFYNIHPLRLQKVTFEYMKNAADLIRATKEAITEGNDVWYVIDSPTRLNCIYTAIRVCLLWRENFKVVTDKTCRIKKGEKFKKSLEVYNIGPTTYDTLKYIARCIGINLTVYDETFELRDVFNYGETLVNIMVNDNHAKAMIKKEDILNFQPEFDFPTITYKNEIYNERRIFQKLPEKAINDKIVAWDIETYLESKDKTSKIGSDKKFIPYASGLAFMYDDQLEESYIFDDNNNLEQLFAWVWENIEIFDGYTFYAHNGGKFDIILLLRDVLLKNPNVTISSKGLIEINSSIIGLSIKYRNPDNNVQYSLHFKDSYRMFQSSLKDVTTDFGVENQKGELDHHYITKATFRSMKKNIMEYLRNDVVGLLQVLNMFNENIFNEFNISLPSCYTSASLAKKIFYLPKYCFCKHGLFTPSKFVDEYVRPGYTGGRCEVFRMGEVENVFYYDYTSLYPAVGRQPLPVGSGEFIKLDDISMETFIDRLDSSYYDNDRRIGFVRCLVRNKTKKYLPLHGIKHEGKLIFPHIENWVELTLSTYEVVTGLKFGYEYKPIDAVIYARNNVMWNFFTDGFEKKRMAKKKGLKAIELMWKIIINSGYGFWGYNPNGKSTLKLYKDSNWKIPLATGQLKSFKAYDNGDVFATIESHQRPSDTNVAIAAYITSYARIRLHALCSDIEEIAPGSNIYCDTDSLITTFDISSSVDLLRKYRRDGDGLSLGSLKNELGLDNDDRDLKFDKVTVVGCKAYALLYNGLPWSSKLKGLKKVDSKGAVINDQDRYDSIIAMDHGDVVEQFQMMIMCNKQDYMTTGFELRYTENEGNPKRFVKQYTKGIVEVDGHVTPLTVCGTSSGVEIVSTEEPLK